MAVTNIDIVATQHGDLEDTKPWLADYDSSNLAGVLVGRDWQDYADTTALHAALTFGMSAGSLPPAGPLRVTKVNDDPVFPDRVIRYFFPYNDDCTGCTGSAGRAPTHTMSNASPVSNFWVRFLRRFGGTNHPTLNCSSNWTTVGSWPTPSANAYKVAFINWQGGNGRMDYAITNTDKDQPGFEFSATTFTEHAVSEAGFVTWHSTVTPALDGSEWVEYIFNYIKESDDISHTRGWRRVLTNGGVYDPQTYAYFGHENRRTAGNAFPQVSNFALGVNKNRTNQDDGLSAVTWDNPDTFSTDSSTSGTARDISEGPFKGMRCDYGPIVTVDGTVNSDPFSVDYFGRGDTDWTT